ncbi:Uncharacterised protein [Mycobacteroides abscessus]|nr:Uncharacterised protein [Mycobacteroides abscessus]
MGRAPSGPTEGLRHQRYISMPSAVTANAPRATAKDTSGAPPYRARPNIGLSPCPNATRPHGNPPNGTLALPHSVADHAAANHNGQPGRFRTATASSPNSATHSAHSRDSANQGTAPTSCPVQGSSGMKNARPKSSPYPSPPRSVVLGDQSTSPRTDSAGNAAHQKPHGGKLAHNARPAISAAPWRVAVRIHARPNATMRAPTAAAKSLPREGPASGASGSSAIESSVRSPSRSATSSPRVSATDSSTVSSAMDHLAAVDGSKTRGERCGAVRQIR